MFILHDILKPLQNEFSSSKLGNVDELTSTSRRTDLGRICPISDHKS